MHAASLGWTRGREPGTTASNVKTSSRHGLGRRSAGLVLLAALGLGACRKSAPTELKESTPSARADGVAQAITPRVSMVGDVSALVFRFPLGSTRVTLADLGMSRDLAGARVRTNAMLVVNGGFFDPTNRAEGLAITDGKELAPLDRALSGGVLVIDGGKGELFESESFVAPLSPPRFALQCRPRLVVGRKRNIGRDDGKRAARTALCLHGRGRVLDVWVARAGGPEGEDGPTLYALAEAMVNAGCEDALNLDGGPSTGWSYRDGAGQHDAPPARKVRHGVVFAPR